MDALGINLSGLITQLISFTVLFLILRKLLFGPISSMLQTRSEKIKESKLEFVIEPYLRFEGKPGEQKTMFFQDPFGNSLEFKSFKSDDEIFKST